MTIHVASTTTGTTYLGPSTETGGAPTSGTWSLGQVAYDSSDRVWLCVVAGSPGTWVLKDSLGSPRVIDLCAPPYSCAAGGDITTALQDAINDANTSDLDTTLFFSQPGVYQVNGSQQTGTSQGYSYSGQILFPARGEASSTLAVRLLGLTPAAARTTGDEPAPVGGVVLLSNATSSGSMFDAIPSYTEGTSPFTALIVTFENLVLRAPPTTPCTAVNGHALRGLAFRGQSRVDTDQAFTYSAALPTTGNGIVFPNLNNCGVCSIDGQLAVVGYRYGILHSEHLLARGLCVQQCAVGISVYGSALYHPSRYECVGIEQCGIGVYANPTGGGGRIEGSLALETGANSSIPLTAVISDSAGLLAGDLRISMSTGGSLRGWPASLSAPPSLSWRGFDQAPRAWQDAWPLDTFARCEYPTTTNLGVSDSTLSPWSIISGAFHIASNASLQATTASGKAVATMWYDQKRFCPSRIVRMVVTSGSSYNVGIVAGANEGQTGWLLINLADGEVAIQKSVSGTLTSLATSDASVVAGSTKYTVDAVIASTPGGDYSVSVYVLAGTGEAFRTGTNVVSYTLDSTDISDIAGPSTVTLTQDGVCFQSDTGSVISRFQVMPSD